MSKILADPLERELASYQAILDTLPCAALILEKGTRRILLANLLAKELGAVLGETCFETCAKRKVPCPFCEAKDVWDTNAPRQRAVEYQGKYYEARWFPLNEKCYVHYIFDVTDRKRIETGSLDNEKKYRSLFENMLSGVAHCKMLYSKGRPSDFIYLDVNSAFERLTGLKDVVGKKVSELIPNINEQSPELFEVYGRVAETGQPASFEYYFQPLKMWLAITVHSTEPDHFVAVFNDISERKRAEDALKKSEEQYRAVIEGQTSVICRFLSDGTITFANDVYCQFFGKTRKELIGKKWMPAAHPDDLEMIKKKLATMTISNPVLTIENRVYSGEGKIRWMQFINKGFYDKAGRLTEIQSVGRDITELKEVENALIASEDKYRKFYNSLMDACVTVDMKGRIIDSNESYRKMLGYSSEELARLTYEDLTPEKYHAVEAKIIKDEILPRGYSEIYQKEYRRKNGEIFPIEIRCFLVRDDHDNPKSMWAIVRDITERRKAEEAIRNYTTKLEEQNRSVEQKNVALAELIEHMERSKIKIKEDIALNISETILPILSKLRKKDFSKKYLDLLDHHLKELASSFGRKITDKSTRLSPKELELCNLLKGGLSSKEISELLNISSMTVDKHRRNVRKKLGISNKKVNLTSYLQKL